MARARWRARNVPNRALGSTTGLDPVRAQEPCQRPFTTSPELHLMGDAWRRGARGWARAKNGLGTRIIHADHQGEDA
jgi:hypothetical protein